MPCVGCAHLFHSDGLRRGLLTLNALAHMLRLHELSRVAMMGARRLGVLERTAACNSAQILDLELLVQV